MLTELNSRNVDCCRKDCRKMSFDRSSCIPKFERRPAQSQVARAPRAERKIGAEAGADADAGAGPGVGTDAEPNVGAAAANGPVVVACGAGERFGASLVELTVKATATQANRYPADDPRQEISLLVHGAIMRR